MYGREFFNTTSNILDDRSSKSSQIIAICALVLLNIISIPIIFKHVTLFALNSYTVLFLGLLPILILMPLTIFGWNDAHARLSESEINKYDDCCSSKDFSGSSSVVNQNNSNPTKCIKQQSISFIPKKTLEKMTKGETGSEKRNRTPVATQTT